MNSLIKTYLLDKTTWTYKGFHGVLHTFFPVASLDRKLKKIFGDSNRVTLFFVKDNYVHWYWNDRDLTRLRNTFLRRMKRNPRYLRSLTSRWRSAIRAFDAVVREVHAFDLTKLSDGQLARAYDRFYEAYTDQFAYFMALGDAISMHSERYLVPEFEKVLGSRFPDLFPLLVSTQHVSFVEQEEKNRENLVRMYRRNKGVPRPLLVAHARKYFYIQNNYARGVYLSPRDFERMIRADSHRPLTHPLKKRRPSKVQLIRQLRLTAYQRLLLDIMDEFFGIQDTRKKYVLISNYYQMRFLREAERRTGIPFPLLCYSIYPEYRSVLNRTISVNLLKQRKRLCLCIVTPKGFQVLIGKQPEALFERFQRLDMKRDELKGMVASKGKATGRVKIILKIHDMVNMEDGDILVSSMTRPEMLPAMKRAAAIVTDEGGITSHAAIVSRELGIPCVIGTKVATRVLKDGDRVEVDAERGIVRKLLDPAPPGRSRRYGAGRAKPRTFREGGMVRGRTKAS